MTLCFSIVCFPTFESVRGALMVLSSFWARGTNGGFRWWRRRRIWRRFFTTPLTSTVCSHKSPCQWFIPWISRKQDLSLTMWAKCTCFVSLNNIFLANARHHGQAPPSWLSTNCYFWCKFDSHMSSELYWFEATVLSLWIGIGWVHSVLNQSHNSTL